MCYVYLKTQPPSLFCIWCNATTMYTSTQAKTSRSTFIIASLPPLHSTEQQSLMYLSLLLSNQNSLFLLFPNPTYDHLYLILRLFQYISGQFFFSYSFLFYSQFLFQVTSLKMTYTWKFYYLLKKMMVLPYSQCLIFQSFCSYSPVFILTSFPIIPMSNPSPQPLRYVYSSPSMPQRSKCEREEGYLLLLEF